MKARKTWAEKLRDSKRDADLGEVIIDSESGRILKNDLHIDRVD